MKQLYIRKGNSNDTLKILIVGEESSLGSRDISGYRPNKGAVFNPLSVDTFTGAEGLTYIHATPNIMLDTKKYSSDHDVHKFIKEYCKDIVTWDGETNEGLVRSREAFIVNSKSNTATVANELYKRIETEIHGGKACRHIRRKRFWHVIGVIISIPFRIIWWILKLLFGKKKRRRRR